MSQRRLRVHPDVLSVDVPDATAYYDEIDPKLGDRLSGLIVHAINQIEAHPLVFVEYLTGFRRVVLPVASRRLWQNAWTPLPPHRGEPGRRRQQCVARCAALVGPRCSPSQSRTSLTTYRTRRPTRTVQGPAPS